MSRQYLPLCGVLALVLMQSTACPAQGLEIESIDAPPLPVEQEWPSYPLEALDLESLPVQLDWSQPGGALRLQASVPVPALNGEALKLGQPGDLHVGAPPGRIASSETGDTGQSRRFQLELNQSQTAELAAALGSNRFEISVAKPDAFSTRGETRYQIGPALNFQLKAQEQASVSEQPTTLLSNRVEWTPLEQLRWNAQVERTQRDTDPATFFSSGLQSNLGPLQLNYDWKNASQSGSVRQDDGLAARLQDLVLGPANFSLYGRVERFGLNSSSFNQRDIFGSGVKVLFGSVALQVRFESTGQLNQNGRDQSAGARLTFPLFEQANLDLGYDNNLRKTGGFNQGLAADVRVKALRFENVYLSAGYELREGMDWSGTNFGALTGERLNLGIKLPQIELTYSRGFSIFGQSGQPGSDSLSIQVHSNF